MTSMPIISIRVPEDLLEQIDARGAERSKTIRRDLARLYRLYDRALCRG